MNTFRFPFKKRKTQYTKIDDEDVKASTLKQGKYTPYTFWATTIGALAATAGAVVALLPYIHQPAQAPSPTLQSSSTQQEPLTPSIEPQAAPTDESSAQAGSPVSGCYDSNTPTPCDSPHSREVFAKPAGSSCDASALILHMGGTPGVDLLAPGLDVKPLENTEDRCVAERPSGMPNAPLKDIWASDNDHNGYKDGGELRRCFTRQGQATSCDAEHASEEFYDAPEEVDCGKKYEDFSGRPVDHSIRVTRQTRDHRIVCRAEVQVSTDRLTASVRDLENATLPIKQN